MHTKILEELKAENKLITCPLKAFANNRICFSSQFFIAMSLKGKTLNPLIGFQRTYALKRMARFKKMFED